MLIESNIQKWGNSSAIRLPAKILAASGISPSSKVDIQAGDGCVVIQLHEKTKEQSFDKIFADIPEAEELLKFVKEQLTKTISLTDKTTKSVLDMRKKLSGNQ